jgi:hypothetical protein
MSHGQWIEGPNNQMLLRVPEACRGALKQLWQLWRFASKSCKRAVLESNVQAAATTVPVHQGPLKKTRSSGRESAISLYMGMSSRLRQDTAMGSRRLRLDSHVTDDISNGGIRAEVLLHR